jgi:hypothetical protein
LAEGLDDVAGLKIFEVGEGPRVGGIQFRKDPQASAVEAGPRGADDGRGRKALHLLAETVYFNELQKVFFDSEARG